MSEYSGEYVFCLDDDGESYFAELILGARHLVFPSEYLGLPVSTVWANETDSENRGDVNEVIVPSGIRFLEGELLECFASLERIFISDSVEYISPNSICCCDNLFDITVDADNKTYRSIDGNLYSKDGETFIKAAPARIGDSFAIPHGVRKIEERAFEGCHKLKRIVLPETLTEIGRNAFMGCKSIEYIRLPEGLEKIDSFAFSCCTSLLDITLPRSLLGVGYCLFFEANEKLTVNCETDKIGERWDKGWSEGVRCVRWGLPNEIACQTVI